MKNRPQNTFPVLTWLTLLLLLSFSAFAQQHEQSKAQVIPKSVEIKLQRDAARLALRAIASSGNLEYQHIIIPGYKIEELYGVLTILYKENATARAIEECDVHTFPDPSIDRMVVIFKKNARWAESIKRGGQMTGYDHLNGLLTKYKLNIEKFVRWDDVHDALILRAEEPLNMAALALVFLKIQDVVKVETGVPETTGNDIQVNPVSSGWEVSYLLRFGAHINGTGKVHTWKFRVGSNGSVKFLGESGDQLPSWMDCAKVEKN